VNPLNSPPRLVEIHQRSEKALCEQTIAVGRVPLSIFSQLRLLYLCYFSKPASSRPIYRAIRRHHVQKIVELGVGHGDRALRMIEVARRLSPPTDVHYVGMDLFEGRADSNQPGSSLKEIYQRLRASGARVQLVPGNPSDGLIRLANSLGKVDVLILPVELDSPANARMWFFVPRLLHERSQVFVERVLDDGQTVLAIKPRQEIDRLAAAGVRRHAA
jgi:hypothetical protein